jgi:hypothetical protein
MSGIESEDILRVVEQLGRVNPTDEATGRAIERVRAALAIDQHAKRSHRLRNILMKVGIPSGIAAAIILGIGVAFLEMSTSITLADVQAAVAKRSWVHVKYDDGYETWTDLRGGLRAHRNPAGGHGSICFIDNPKKNVRYWYTMGENVMVQDQPRGYRKGEQPPPWEPRTAWEHELGWIEKTLQTPQNSWSSCKAERHEDKIDGKTVTRFDVFYRNAVTDQWILKRQLWADPRTRLPLRIRKKRNSKWVTGEYDFPEEGPTSVYDLGVPREVEVFKRIRGWSSPELERLSQTVNETREKFPLRFRAVEWDVRILRKQERTRRHYGSGLRIRQEPGEEIHEMHIVVTYRDRERMRVDRYVCLRHHAEKGPEVSPPLPATVEDIVSWTKTHTPVHTRLWDGEKRFVRVNTYSTNKRLGKPSVRVSLDAGVSDDLDDRIPYRHLWPPISQWLWWPLLTTKTMKPRPDVEPGCLGVSTFGLAVSDGQTWKTRSDYHLDPNKDYLCVKKVD